MSSRRDSRRPVTSDTKESACRQPMSAENQGGTYGKVRKQEEERKQEERRMQVKKYVCLVHFDRSQKVFKTFVNASDRKDAIRKAYCNAKAIHTSDEWRKLGMKNVEASLVEPMDDGA